MLQSAKDSKTKPKEQLLKSEDGVRVLGIDPGLGRIGYGLVEEHRGKLKMVDYGCLETSKTENIEIRLLELKRLLDDLIKRSKPVLVAVEALFFSKNIKTALSVAEARGVILLGIAEARAPLLEISPQQVKQAVTGYGKAEKGQVQKMVACLLGLPKTPKPDDAADGLALAIAAAQMRRFLKNI